MVTRHGRRRVCPQIIALIRHRSTLPVLRFWPTSLSIWTDIIDLQKKNHNLFRIICSLGILPTRHEGKQSRLLNAVTRSGSVRKLDLDNYPRRYIHLQTHTSHSPSTLPPPHRHPIFLPSYNPLTHLLPCSTVWLQASLQHPSAVFASTLDASIIC